MTTQQNKIENLTTFVNNANTAIEGGRSIVVDCCQQLYNLIEEDVYKADCEWMLKGMYNDLCNGNFAEPFYCELKKNEFNKIVAIYNERIVPNL